MTYQEKLKDPRWQKKRLEIMERDNWQCQSCYDDESTLHIHHKYYMKCDPWEYPEDALITLCAGCHEDQKELRPGYESDLLAMLKRNFLAGEIYTLTQGFHSMPMCHVPEVVASSIAWALSDEDMQREIIESYFKHIKESKNAPA